MGALARAIGRLHRSLIVAYACRVEVPDRRALLRATLSVARVETTLNGIAAADIEVSAAIDISSSGNVGLWARYIGPGDYNAYLGLLQPVSGGTFAAHI